MKIFYILFLLSSSLFAKVVVIGGGFAGLTTAYRLQERGFDVEVYEAKGRVGGRVFTVKLGNKIVELGAQNIRDGGEAKNLCALISDLKLETSSNTYVPSLYFVEGDVVTHVSKFLEKRNFDPETLHTTLEALSLIKKNMKEVLDALFEADDPLYKLCALHLTAYEGGAPEELSTIYVETVYHRLLGGLSATHPGKKEETQLEQLIVQGGNAQVAEKIKEKLGTKIHLNCPLSAIAKEGKGYELTFKDGSQVHADTLVLTIPCPVYKDIAIGDDVIPEERRECIQQVGYAQNSKIVVPVDNYTEISAHTDGIATTFRNVTPSTLNLFFKAPESIFDEKTVVDRLRKHLSLVTRFYTMPSDETAVVASDENFINYTTPVGYSWGNDPLAGGAYSYVKAGQEEDFTTTTEYLGETVKTLFEPIEGTLFFAGEHTTTIQETLGTMEGAVESGEKAARLIEKTRGIALRHITTKVPQRVHILEVDPKRFSIVPKRALDMGIGRESVLSLSQRNGAFAAINGGFFAIDGTYEGAPRGILKIDRDWYSLPTKPRGAIGWSTDELTPHFDRLLAKAHVEINGFRIDVDGFNQKRGDDEITLFSTDFGFTTLTHPGGLELGIQRGRIKEVNASGSCTIPRLGHVLSIGKNLVSKLPSQYLKKGLRAKARFEIFPQLGQENWSGFDHIVGGTPLLIYNGERLTDFTPEKTIETFLTHRHARTAVGVLENGNWLFVVVDGNLPESEGMTIEELALFMENCGCTYALNLDGGGSSTMVYKNEVVNTPCVDVDENSKLRKVSDAILILPLACQKECD